MTFYFNRETGQRVSKSTWTRSKAHGGSKFVRRRVTPSPKENTRSGTGRRAPSNPSEFSTQGSSSPSQNPRTYQEWMEYFQKLSKRKRKQIEDQEDFEGPEYETGVDY